MNTLAIISTYIYYYAHTNTHSHLIHTYVHNIIIIRNKNITLVDYQHVRSFTQCLVFRGCEVNNNFNRVSSAGFCCYLADLGNSLKWIIIVCLYFQTILFGGALFYFLLTVFTLPFEIVFFESVRFSMNFCYF